MIVTERLDRSKHNRLAFSCGEESLDRFLHETAHQAFKKNVAATFVAIDRDVDPAKILGFYSVSSFQADAGDIPDVEKHRRRLPSNRLPATLVGRLAVDRHSQKKGLGGYLLMDAFVRCFRASQHVASAAIIVDALDESVVPFYEQYGFQRCAPDSLKLFIMMDTVAQLPVVQQRLKEQTQEAI